MSQSGTLAFVGPALSYLLLFNFACMSIARDRNLYVLFRRSLQSVPFCQKPVNWLFALVDWVDPVEFSSRSRTQDPSTITHITLSPELVRELTAYLQNQQDGTAFLYTKDQQEQIIITTRLEGGKLEQAVRVCRDPAADVESFSSLFWRIVKQSILTLLCYILFRLFRSLIKNRVDSSARVRRDIV